MPVSVGDLVVVYETEHHTSTIPLLRRTIGVVTYVLEGPDDLVLITPYKVFSYFLGYFDQGRSLPAGEWLCCARSEATLAFRGV